MVLFFCSSCKCFWWVIQVWFYLCALCMHGKKEYLVFLILLYSIFVQPFHLLSIHSSCRSFFPGSVSGLFHRFGHSATVLSVTIITLVYSYNKRCHSAFSWFLFVEVQFGRHNDTHKETHAHYPIWNDNRKKCFVGNAEWCDSKLRPVDFLCSNTTFFFSISSVLCHTSSTTLFYTKEEIFRFVGLIPFKNLIAL